MHGILPGKPGVAISRAGQSVSETPKAAATEPITDQTDSDGNGWFVAMASALLGKDAGYHLHLITGFEERTCYRYAAGDRKPPGYFICALLRSEQGAQFLAAIMDGSNAEWWRELERAKRIAAQVEQLSLE